MSPTIRRQMTIMTIFSRPKKRSLQKSKGLIRQAVSHLPSISRLHRVGASRVVNGVQPSRIRLHRRIVMKSASRLSPSTTTILGFQRRLTRHLNKENFRHRRNRLNIQRPLRPKRKVNGTLKHVGGLFFHQKEIPIRL